MGITRQYLKWIPSSLFGVVASSASNIVLSEPDSTNKQVVIVGACEKIFVWNYKTGELMQTLSDGESEVTQICAFRNEFVVSGHADGTVRIFDLITGQLKVTFSGHKSAVTSLALSGDGMRLASGGKDTEIVVWDVVNESGLFRLKGHKHGITKLQFMVVHDNILVSSSRDTFVKFWDLDTQHCSKTLTGHRSEIWSFVLIKNDSQLITGAGDSELKVWNIVFKTDDPEVFQKKLEESKNDANEAIDGEEDDEDKSDDRNEILVVTRFGSIMRKSFKKLTNICVDQEERMLICHGFDSLVECFKIRTDEEIKETLQKRTRKEKRKLKRANPEENSESMTVTVTPTLSDEIERIESIKTYSKIKGCDLRLVNKIVSIVTLSANNYFQLYSCKSNSISENICNVKLHGHRSDVRTVSFSSDNFFILSASAESVKIWSVQSQKCVATIDEEIDYCLCSSFIPGDRFCVLGTKTGKLQIIEIGVAKLQETIKASEDGQPIWSICLYPNQRGLVSGSEDKLVKFWDFDLIVDSESKARRLTLTHQRTLQMDEGVLCVRISPNFKFVAVSLLDSTVKVFFMDTLKFFLSLYGHKFPVLCMDISYDSTLIATGSSDKNVKIWGLDFGDCHKSMFAHDDNVTALQFVPKTHYFFTGSKDKSIKEWDADNFEKIMTLTGHQAEVWALAVSSNGKYICSASHDKSLRIWEKTNEPLVLEEEQENEREREFESTAYENDEMVIPGEVNNESTLASKKTIETVKGTERLIEALDLFKEETLKISDYEKQCHLAEENNQSEPEKPSQNPLMQMYNTTCPYRMMLEALRRIKSNELEKTILTLPFNYVTDLLIALTDLLEKNWEVELLGRCACFILRVHFGQITATSSLVVTIEKLKKLMKTRVNELKDIFGLNLAGLRQLNEVLSSREEASLFVEAMNKSKEKKKKRAKNDLSKNLETAILTWT